MFRLTTGHIIDIIVDASRDNSAQLDTVLLKVASRCNINCTYCYVYNMGDDNWTRMEKIMKPDTMQAIADSLKEMADRQPVPFSIVLHGGEPFLIGVAKLAQLLSLLRNAVNEDYPISIQTNGILISNEILNICSRYKASVAVSIDGPRHINDKLRVTHRNTGTFDQVIKGITLLKTHPDAAFLNAGLLAVIDPTSDPYEVYNFFKELAPPSVDFLYKDGNHTNLPTGKTSIHSTEYGEWVSRLMQLYLNDKNPLPIRVIDDMLKVLIGGTVTKEGMGITNFGIVIIDTDGTLMKNDTLKSSYNGADKFAKPVNIKERNLYSFLESEAFMEYRNLQQPTHTKCLSCSMLNICGGGMILHRWSKENQFDNPSVYCADQIHLINSMSNAVAQYDLENV